MDFSLIQSLCLHQLLWSDLSCVKHGPRMADRPETTINPHSEDLV